MKVTIFGGASPKPGQKAYLDAQRLGGLLAQAGDTILTGGYIGTMEAASRGAAEAGGHVIGVTCAEIERIRPFGANAWVTEERRFETLSARLNELLEACDAAIALPGGVGTISEIVMLWNRFIIESRPVCPLILVGTGWKRVFNVFFASQDDYLPLKDRCFLQFVDTVDESFQILHPDSPAAS